MALWAINRSASFFIESETFTSHICIVSLYASNNTKVESDSCKYVPHVKRI